MTLFRMLLKILSHFRLVDTEAKQILNADIEKFELEATPDSPDKIKAIYGRIHQGLYVRLLLPFLFFVGVKHFKQMVSDDADDPFEND